MSEAGDSDAGEYDPWRFAGSFLKNAIGSQIPAKAYSGEIPWTDLSKPLSEARVALLSTAGISMRTDAPFDMEMERKRPTHGDPSFRKLRADATSDSIRAHHLHIDTGYIESDLNVALPLDRLRERVADGTVGSMADTHYSIMGYQGSDSSILESETAPKIAEAMRSEEVDLALLAPV
jgi:D-proline reductase (dithiol) PrdB